MTTIARYKSKFLQALLVAATVICAVPTNATVSIGDTPLFLAVTVPPNIVLTLDDTGSMRRAFVPENCLADTSDCTHLDNRYEKSAHRNLIYYNPNVKYPAPKNAAGNVLTTTFASAYRNGFDTALVAQDAVSGANLPSTVNLSTSFRPTAYLDFNGSATEAFMGHYSGDAQCNTATNQCQFRDASGNFANIGLACAGSTTTAKNNFCRGTHGTTTPTPPPVPAYYYVFDGSNTNCIGTAAQKAVDNDCYDLKIVSATSGPATVDLNGDGIVNSSDADERQNFANWYSFARTRSLATQTAASLAFADLDPSFRVAFQAVNSCRGSTTSLVDSDCDGWKNNFSGVSNAIRPFNGTHRNNFYNWLFQQPTAGGTALPEAMKRVGDYFSTTGDGSPYDNDFMANGSSQHACRRNYHILFTDGMWTTGASVTKQDNSTNVDLPEDGPVQSGEPPITAYRPPITTPIDQTVNRPYQDAYSGTLADVAFHYWISDLVPTAQFPNIVPDVYRDRSGSSYQQYWNPRNDPATWQHMVNFIIGLGLSGYINDPSTGLTWDGNMYGGSYPQLVSGAKQWPQAMADSTGTTEANAADLWHAAINSRGQFFSADDPASLASAFRESLSAISNDRGASAALSTNTTSLQPGQTVVYQAKFDRGWSGGLLAYQLDSMGRASSTPLWDAGEKIPAHNLRNIFTYNGTMGVAFTAAGCSNSEFSNAQKAALNKNGAGVVDSRCDLRVDWLRGDIRHEQRNLNVNFGGSPAVVGLGYFRNRPTRTVGGVTTTILMGDIINSDPAYVKDIDYGYANLPVGTPGQDSYASFVLANRAVNSRLPMVYVGSNDGRLYGIRADSGNAASGVEQFSYIPAGVFDNLSKLTDPSYAHKYFVDGGVTAADAFIQRPSEVAASWHSVVLGGLNAGGKSIYALDVTDPGSFNASKVMWEFTDADMGFSYSRPQVGILENGSWVAVFGNGYNSTNGGAYLYVVNLADGTLLKKITVRDVAGDESNGLSTPLLFDADDDKLIDTVYAGDLLGNLWKIDLSGAAAGAWGVAYSSQPLFTARNASNQVQPITAQPAAGDHPSGGTMLFFGTGRYLHLNDVSDTTVQSFYGIRDSGTLATTYLRSDLQQQSFVTQVNGTPSTRGVRTVSNNSVDYSVKKGYYLDLVDPPGIARGERVVSKPLHPKSATDRVLFVTIVPSSDPCDPGGVSWLVELTAFNGGAFPSKVLDTNGDGVVNDDDATAGAVQIMALGLSNTPVLYDYDPDPNITGDEQLFKVLTGTNDRIETVVNGNPQTSPPPSGVVIRRSWIQIR